MGGQTLGSVTALYSLAIGFALSMIAIIIASLVTPAPSTQMLEEFDDVINNRNIEG